MASSETHRTAQQAALDAMGEVAWPTVIFGCAIIVGYPSVLIAAGLGMMPVWAAFIILSVLVYASYTVVHEAVHGSISGKETSLDWLNEGLGHLAAQVLGAPFVAHRKEHIDHHRFTNIADQDPDLPLVSGSLLTVLMGVLRVLPLQTSHYMRAHWIHASRRDRIVLAVEIMVMILWRVAFLVWVGWQVGLLLLIGASAVGVFITLVFFAWIVHWPHASVGRFVDTTTFVFPGVIDDVVTRLWLYQNYHSVHHLFPRVPFYRYRQVFRRIEGHMEENGAPILRLGTAR